MSDEKSEKQFGLRLPGELWEALGKERDRLASERPGARVTITDTIREVLWRGLWVSGSVAPPRRAASRGPERVISIQRNLSETPERGSDDEG
jgi:hypothetical protein